MAQPTSAKHARKTDPAAGATTAKPAKSRRKAIPLLALGIATALVAGQVAGTSYYGSHFVPGTTVNGADVSNMTEAELARQVATSAASWKTTVAGQGLTFAIGATDIDLDVSPADYARDAKAQTDAASWALDLTHPRHTRCPRPSPTTGRSSTPWSTPPSRLTTRAPRRPRTPGAP